MIYRLLAMLAATTPTFLSVLLPGESCGYFGYELPEPGLMAEIVWTGASWSGMSLPVLLALLALWAPRRFTVLATGAAVMALAFQVLTVVVPYAGVCGEQRGDWRWLALGLVVVGALLMTRRERARPVPPVRAVAWTAVVLVPFVLAVLDRMPSDADPGCFAELKGVWALLHMHVLNAETYGLWIAVTALGALFAGSRGGAVAGAVLLVPALYEPLAQVITGAQHDCSSLPALVSWPYLVCAVLALLNLSGRARTRPAPAPR